MDGNGCDYVELSPENEEVWELYARVCNQVLVAADGTVLGLNLGTVAQIMDLLGIEPEKRSDYLSMVIRIHDVVCPPKKKEADKEPPRNPNGR
jgi:hypothetical protein